MKKKLILIMLVMAVFLSSCTVNVYQYQHWNWTSNTPVYKLVYSVRKGGVKPIINIFDLPRQQSTRR